MSKKHDRKAQTYKFIDKQLKLKNLKFNLRSDRSMFTVDVISRDASREKREITWRRNRRRFLIVLSFWSIPAFLSGRGSCPFSPDWNCAHFFERSDIIALLDVRAPSEHSRNASFSSVLSHSLAALFILFSDPCTSYSSLPLFFFFFFIIIGQRSTSK